MISITNQGGATDKISRRLEVSPRSVRAALDLLGEGATIPFIARYRKERTGGLDEVQLRRIEDLFDQHRALESRRETILTSLRQQEVLTADLEREVRSAPDLSTLEDLYLPWRPRRRTRADAAREEGLEPLARELLSDSEGSVSELVQAAAARLGLAPERSLAGASDIIAADIAIDKELRSGLRELFRRQGAVRSKRKMGKGATGKAKTDKSAPNERTSSKGRSGNGKSGTDQSGPSADTWRDYFDWREPARACPSHRLLAILRGEAAGVLRVEVQPPQEAGIRIVEEFLRERDPRTNRDRRELFRNIAGDAYKRLLAPSLEGELRKELRERAEEAAVTVFAANLEDLLMAPPLGPKPVLAIDPGFRTGSKVVALDGTGAVREHRAIFPLPPQNRCDEAGRAVQEIVQAHEARAVAVGSGTGGREVEQFVRSLAPVDRSGATIPVVRVNEAGASVYSASVRAREEMPDLDVTVRGAVSIGRRLQDPLSELVKIDPAAVGVGQYQHDVDPGRMEHALNRTVETCVNAVGVELNTAGTALLERVSGLGPSNAAAIVAHRDRHGPFSERSGIAAVSGIGPRTVELAVGFLRCSGTTNPLENTGVHPERYPLVKRIAADLGCTVAELCGNGTLLDRVDPTRYVADTDSGAGLPTITDILAELRSPGRDPRREFDPVSFREDVNEIGDLAEGMVLTGIVTNVTRFGAFVDIGVHRDGLIHISKLSRSFVRDPREVVRVGQSVEVSVLAVDCDRQRIDLQVHESPARE